MTTIRNTLMPLTRNGFLFEPMVDRLVTRAFDTPVWSGGAEVKELEDRVQITLDVPGVRPEQIRVGAEHRTLTVKVERDGRGTFTRQYASVPSTTSTPCRRSWSLAC
jgi:HSP20 family molecular chaperone IbpA